MMHRSYDQLMEEANPHPHPGPGPGPGSRCELHPQSHEGRGGSFCPSCLRDRLSGLDLGSDSDCDYQSQSHHQSQSHLRRCSSFSFSARPHLHPHSTPTMKMHILDLHLQSQSKSKTNSSKSKSKSSFSITKYWHDWRHPRSQPQPTNSDAPARASFDCPPRFSFDAHSASTRPLISSHHRFHPLLSAPTPHLLNDHQNQNQNHIPLQLEHDDTAIPGSQSQTRDYYLHSSSSRSNRHRRSFESSASLRKLDTDHWSVQPAFNSKVSPAGNAEFYHYHPSVANRDIDIPMSMSASCSSAFQFQDPCKTQVAPDKKNKKWSKGWSLWGLIQRKGNSKDQPAKNSAMASGHSDHFLRCNSSISARSSFSSYSAAGSIRRKSVDIININSHANSHNRRDEFVLERNRSARFSPSQVDNGMLRFYLTPTLTPTRGNQSGRRNSGVRPVTTGSQSMSSRPVHRLY